MAKQLTLNQTIKLIREIALSHDQINTVYFGDVWEFLARTDNVYPAMFYSLTGSSISGKNLAMDFSLFFLDRQLQDETNETDVLSDQLLIAQDIFAMFNYPKFDWEIDTDVSIEFFTENEKDYLAGVKFDITLNYPMLNDRCQVPSSFSYPEYVASISQNGGAVNYIKFLIDYPSFATLPANGDSSKIYVTNDNNKLYRWVDNAFIEISPTSSTTWGNIGGTLSSQTDLQTALNAKAPLASPTFTGTVSGITKSMVGLGNVDNTTDLLKPISTATQTALNLKYDASNPSNYLTGITSGQVTTALGFTPYNATNPSGYTTNVGTVTSVGALTLGTTGTDVSSTVANGTTTPVITLNIPTASATNRGALSSTDWTTFNGKQSALGYTAADDSLVVHLAGTETITGRKTFNPSVTASSAIARGTNLTPTLIASANSDVLVGLDIAPTYTAGAFTGVTNIGIRYSGRLTSTGTFEVYRNTNQLVMFVDNSETTLVNSFSTARIAFRIASTDYGRFSPTTGNFILANGGTFTDAGYRLDVTGTARVSTSLNIGGTTTNASAILQADSTTKGVLFPRMTTTQKNAISSPATGLVVFDTTLEKLCVFSTTWQTITSI